MVCAVPFVLHDAPAEAVGWADGFDAVVFALVDFFLDVEGFDGFDGGGVCARAVDSNSLKPEAVACLGGQCPTNGAGAGLAGVAVSGGVFSDPVAGFAGGGVGSYIVDTSAAEIAVGVFAEDSGADFFEGGGVGEGEHLFADVFGGGFEGAVVVLGPGHPGEEVVVAGFVDGGGDFLGVGELVGADDEAVRFEVAVEGFWGGPSEAWGWKVEF